MAKNEAAASCYEFCLPLDARTAITDSLAFAKEKMFDSKADGSKAYDYGIFSCFSNPPLALSICCCAPWGQCVFFRNMERMTGKSCEVAFVNATVTGAVCLGPCYYAHVRGEFRKKYGLSGSHLSDCLYGCCLGPCVVCADANQLMALETYSIPNMTIVKPSAHGSGTLEDEKKSDTCAWTEVRVIQVRH